MSDRSRKLKEKLSSGAMSPGAWMAIPDPTVAEVMADAGFEWIIVDSEHSPFNPETLQHILMGFHRSETVPFVRVPWNDPIMIKQALDMGWEGIVTPQTNSAEEVRRAVAAARYPPLGNRGFGPRRAGRYYRDQAEYVGRANSEIILAAQIENIGGVDEIEDMAAVPGLDWVLVGRYDMSATLDGLFCQVDHPRIWEAMQKIVRAAQAHGLPAGVPLGSATPENLERYRLLGGQLMTIGEDLAYMQEGAQNALVTWRNTFQMT
jgi:2-keto-3-deoxy-L-rhamnonate aldolase RhmA